MKQFEYGGNPVSKTFESLIDGVNDPSINDNNDKEWIKEHDKRMAKYEKEMEDPHDCSTCKYRRLDDISCGTCGPDYENWVSEVERNINIASPCILETLKEPAAFATRVMNNLSSHKNESMIDIGGSIIHFLDSFFERPYPYAILTIWHSGMHLDRYNRNTWDIYECQRQIDILPDEICKILYNRNNPNYSYITHDGMTLRKFLSAGQYVPHTDPLTDYFGQLSEKRFIQQKSLVIPKIVTFRDIIRKAGKI